MKNSEQSLIRAVFKKVKIKKKGGVTPRRNNNAQRSKGKGVIVVENNIDEYTQEEEDNIYSGMVDLD